MKRRGVTDDPTESKGTMNKALAAISLMAAGASVLAGVVYLQTNRYALTQFAPVGEQEVEEVATEKPGEAPPRVASDAPSAAVIALPTMFILSHAPRARSARRPAEPAQLVPCTGWRDLGPVAIRGTEPARKRHVQMLCAENTTPPRPNPPG